MLLNKVLVGSSNSSLEKIKPFLDLLLAVIVQPYLKHTLIYA